MKMELAAAAIAAGVAAGAASGQTSWLSVWGGTGQGGAGYQGGAADSPVMDPMGDAQDAFGAGPPLLDIDTIDIQYDATNLYFSMTFFTPIAAPSEALPESVGGNIEFDVDQSSATGIAPLQNVFSPPFTPLDTGVDYFLELFSEAAHPGMIELIPALGGPSVLVPVTYGDMSISGAVSLSDLGGDDGAVYFTSIIGTFAQPTDAMDVVGASVLVPAPGAMLLLGIGGVAATRRRR